MMVGWYKDTQPLPCGMVDIYLRELKNEVMGTSLVHDLVTRILVAHAKQKDSDVIVTIRFHSSLQCTWSTFTLLKNLHFDKFLFGHLQPY